MNAVGSSLPLRVTVLFNEPVLPDGHPDAAAERGVLEAVEAVVAALERGGHCVRRCAVGPSPAEVVAVLGTPPQPDVVLNLCEGLGGSGAGEAHVAALVELCGLAITGSPPECLALVRDKARTKWLLQGAGVATPPFVVIEPEASPSAHASLVELLAMGPVIVKPACEEASMGIDASSVIGDAEALESRVNALQRRYGRVLVERFVAGREFNVGIVALPEAKALPLAEIEFADTFADAPHILTYEAKWSTGSAADRATPVRCPAQVEQDLADRLARAALRAFSATGCRHYARCDFRVSTDGTVYLLEVNGNPDISPTAGLARMLAASGVRYDDFINALVGHAAATRPEAQAAPPQARVVGAPAVADEPASPGETVVRPFCAGDTPALVEILAACAMFRPDEIDVGREILDEASAAGPGGHYQVLVAERAGAPVGWSCHGRIPLTDASYDLYWIAVHPSCQGRGLGRRLLDVVEKSLRAQGARWLLAETSDLPSYDATQAFYRRTGFSTASHLADFYRGGDGRIVFAKRL